MKDQEKQIDKLSFHLLSGLKKNDYFLLSGKEGALSAKIKDVIMQNLREEAQIERDAKKLMDTYSSQIDRGEVDSRKMFSMIKSKLAKEKGFVL